MKPQNKLAALLVVIFCILTYWVTIAVENHPSIPVTREHKVDIILSHVIGIGIFFVLLYFTMVYLVKHRTQ